MLPEIPPHKKTTAYWDAQARWQQVWLKQNDYHREAITFLAQKVQPGWRVLDIGAGNGILALPLQRLRAEVTVLEPSKGMLALLWGEIRRHRVSPEIIDQRRWEEVPAGEFRDFDLILACNSLQLTTLGFQAALTKMFAPRPRQVCVITEIGFEAINLLVNYQGYQLEPARYYQADSSYAYNYLEEAWEHLGHRLRRPPTAGEKEQLRAALVRTDNQFRLPGTSTVGIFWWTREKEN